MLQIISGKFYTLDERNIYDGVGIAYSNYGWVAPIITRVASLHPVDTVGSVSTYVITYKNQIEANGPLVRIGDDEITEQFRLLCTFGLHAFFALDRETVAVNCREKPYGSSDVCLPSVFVPRFFSAQLRGTTAEIDIFIDLVDKVIGLPRAAYKAVISSISNFSHALQVVSYNIDLAYSLIVYSLEALSQGFDKYTATWSDYPDVVRGKLDPLLRKVDDQLAEQMRRALLNDTHLRLRKRFLEFVCQHINDSFFLEEASNTVRGIPGSQLSQALSNAYNMRSKYVHQLQPIPDQLRVPSVAKEEVFFWENEPYLTFSGLVRLARHVILTFINEQPYLKKEVIRWQDEIPGVCKFELAPQYWVWRHEDFEPSLAHSKLSGFLQELETARLKSCALSNLRELTMKYEGLLSQTKKEEQLSMLALYRIYNLLIEQPGKAPNWDKVCHDYKNLFNECSIQAMLVRVLEDVRWDWSASDCAATLQKYMRSRYKKRRLRLPAVLELSMMLAVGNAFLAEDDIDGYIEWYRMALLDATSKTHIQAAIAEGMRTRSEVTYETLLELSKTGIAKSEATFSGENQWRSTDNKDS